MLNISLLIIDSQHIVIFIYFFLNVWHDSYDIKSVFFISIFKRSEIEEFILKEETDPVDHLEVKITY